MENEKRLIDVNDALERLRNVKPKLHVVDLFGFKAVDIDAFIQFLESRKTVDAVEVVHGEWEIIEDDYFDLVELKCSVCGESYGFEDYEDDTPKNYHYCPNCGAKMDL